MAVWLLLTACTALQDLQPPLEPSPLPVEIGPEWHPSPTSTAPSQLAVEAENEWKTSLPQEQGMDPLLLEEMDRYIRDNNLPVHSVLIVRNGYLVHETYAKPYGPDSLFYIYSVTKSVVSALAGIAIEDGLLQLQEPPLLEILPPGILNTPDPRKERLNLEHLLTMTSGLQWEESLGSMRTAYESPDFVEYMVNRPLMWAPGTAYHYCSGCSHLITAALQAAVDGPLIDYAESKLLEPLGIENYLWETDSQGIPLGGWGLHMRARDMAKLGLLFLQEGDWEGEQIIPQEWVMVSTAPQEEVPGIWDYGYHWWTHPQFPNYAAIGLGGQAIMVFPARNLVIVFAAEGSPPLNALVDAYIIPSIRD